MENQEINSTGSGGNSSRKRGTGALDLTASASRTDSDTSIVTIQPKRNRVRVAKRETVEAPRPHPSGRGSCQWCKAPARDLKKIGVTNKFTCYQCNQCDIMQLGLPRFGTRTCFFCSKAVELIESKNPLSWNDVDNEMVDECEDCKVIDA